MQSLIEKDIQMTSLDIAEITGKNHQHVMRDIRNEIEKLGEEIGQSIFGQTTYSDSQRKQQPCFTFGRKGAMQLALKYDAVTRFKVIEKIEELEGKSKTTQFMVPQTFSQALRLAADLAEDNERMKPKADYFDALVDRNLLTNFRDTAKELKVKEQEFINWLMVNKYIYRDAKGKLRPYAEYAPSLFEIKESTRGNWSGVQTLITPKGRETFRLLLEKGLVKQ